MSPTTRKGHAECGKCGARVQITKKGELAKHHPKDQFCSESGSLAIPDDGIDPRKPDNKATIQPASVPFGSSDKNRIAMVCEQLLMPKKMLRPYTGVQYFRFSPESPGRIVSASSAMNAGLAQKVKVVLVQCGRRIYLNEPVCLADFISMNLIGQLDVKVQPGVDVEIAITTTWEHSHRATMTLVMECDTFESYAAGYTHATGKKAP